MEWRRDRERNNESRRTSPDDIELHCHGGIDGGRIGLNGGRGRGGDIRADDEGEVGVTSPTFSGIAITRVTQRNERTPEAIRDGASDIRRRTDDLTNQTRNAGETRTNENTKKSDNNAAEQTRGCSIERGERWEETTGRPDSFEATRERRTSPTDLIRQNYQELWRRTNGTSNDMAHITSATFRHPRAFGIRRSNVSDHMTTRWEQDTPGDLRFEHPTSNERNGDNENVMNEYELNFKYLLNVY